MCGICCVIPLSPSTPKNPIKLEEPLNHILRNRGPDIQHQIDLSNGTSFYGCVLWQQGIRPTKQPLESERFVLLFNGDIFNATKDKETSDTSWLLSKLNECTSDEDIYNLIRTLQGPYSMIIYNKNDECLYFMRDSLGRNSLLLERNDECLRILSSSFVSRNAHTIEIPSLGVFKLQIPNFYCTLFPWNKKQQLDSVSFVSRVLGIAVKIGDILDVEWSAQKRREPLYNFSDHLRTFKEGNLFENLLSVEPITKTVEQLINLLRHSVSNRAENTPGYCSKCVKRHVEAGITDLVCTHAKIGILFSGGIDCTILAAIANEYVNHDEAIDLINVAFEPVNKSASTIDGFNVPDRLSAIESFNELKSLFPTRHWNLVEVNVSREELESQIQGHICHLIYPLETVLDESLGCAFWFASRGLRENDSDKHEVDCRVILVGSGADELFGGYVRHRNAFNRCKGSMTDKIQALDEELQLDWSRIPTRNLGRDDRIIADNGRTSRAPFIEENLVNFVTGLHPLEICCFELDQGIGDKLLLRLVGHKLGLRNAAQFKKRAIQFGSRIADKNQNAKDTSTYLGRKCLEKN